MVLCAKVFLKFSELANKHPASDHYQASFLLKGSGHKAEKNLFRIPIAFDEFFSSGLIALLPI